MKDFNCKLYKKDNRWILKVSKRKISGPSLWQVVKCWLFCLILLFLSSCNDKYDYYVQPELQYYINSFYAEAAKRGISVERENLILRIENGLRYIDSAITKDRPYAALSGTSRKGQVTIRIDKQYFETADTLCIERTVFHELGHTYFCLRHQFIGKSVMNISKYYCYDYNLELRDSMITELFTHPFCYK